MKARNKWKNYYVLATPAPYRTVRHRFCTQWTNVWLAWAYMYVHARFIRLFLIYLLQNGLLNMELHKVSAGGLPLASRPILVVDWWRIDWLDVHPFVTWCVLYIYVCTSSDGYDGWRYRIAGRSIAASTIPLNFNYCTLHLLPRNWMLCVFVFGFGFLFLGKISIFGNKITSSEWVTLSIFSN